MVSKVVESQDIKSIKAKVDNAREAMSLGSGIGFRQISGIDVITNVEAALRIIEEASREESIEVAARLSKLRGKEYVAKAHIACRELEKDIKSLKEGVDIISELLFDVLSAVEEIK